MSQVQAKRIEEKPLGLIQRLIIVIGIVFVLGMSFWLIWIDSHRIFPIVMYHHIDLLDKFEVATIPPERFEKHLQYLAKNRFDVLTMDELIAAKKSSQPLSRKTVALTFDDGYLDNFTYAFPLLKKYGFKATMFVSSDMVGQPGYMDWNQLREMREYGIVIGSHTRRHKYLPDLTQEELLDEIVNSRKLLQEKLNFPVDHFSYPVGGFNAKIKEIVQKSGYLSAVSTNRGYDRYNKDLFELKRVTIDEQDNFGAIRWAKFSGYYNLFRKPRKPE
ncbi:MAG: polysaccharide deacetylase family protein [Candidatus Omnitrophota bacterium]